MTPSPKFIEIRNPLTQFLLFTLMNLQRLTYQVCPILAIFAFVVIYWMSESTIRSIGVQPVQPDLPSLDSQLYAAQESKLDAFRISAFLIFGLLCLFSGYCFTYRGSADPSKAQKHGSEDENPFYDLCEDAKILVDNDDIVIRTNPAVTSFFGIPRSEIEGFNFKMVINRIASLSEDKDIADFDFALIWRR